MNWKGLIDNHKRHTVIASGETAAKSPKWFKLKGFIASCFKPELRRFILRSDYLILESLSKAKITAKDKDTIRAIQLRVKTRALKAKEQSLTDKIKNMADKPKFVSEIILRKSVKSPK